MQENLNSALHQQGLLDGFLPVSLPQVLALTPWFTAPDRSSFQSLITPYEIYSVNTC